MLCCGGRSWRYGHAVVCACEYRCVVGIAAVFPRCNTFTVCCIGLDWFLPTHPHASRCLFHTQQLWRRQRCARCLWYMGRRDKCTTSMAA